METNIILNLNKKDRFIVKKMIIDKKKQKEEKEKFLKDIDKVIWRSDKKPKKLKSLKEKMEKLE